MCCLAMEVAVYLLLVWVSGDVPCVRWVVFVVVGGYACLCMVCVCVCVCVEITYACLCMVCVCVHVEITYACLCMVCVCVCML